MHVFLVIYKRPAKLPELIFSQHVWHAMTQIFQPMARQMTNYKNALENLHQWLLANKLTLNKGKTEYMIIGPRQRISNLVTDPKIELGQSLNGFTNQKL